MATSSITHNFIITDPKVAERLAKALEESANDPPRPFTVDAKFLEDPDEIRECMEKFMEANKQRKLPKSSLAEAESVSELRDPSDTAKKAPEEE